VIGSLRGVVLERSLGGEVLVEVGGVGYRVLAPARSLHQMVPGERAFLFTHLHARDETFVLYGFPTRDERDTFEALLGANGVGPKLALAILGALDPVELRRAVVSSDLDALTLVPGVGKRTAQRLLVELQARLDTVVLADPVAPNGGTPRAEVREALAGLGYAPDEVRDALGQLADEGPVEDLLRDALRLLAAHR
jgi:Holliday junction DNA helicase RuvA